MSALPYTEKWLAGPQSTQFYTRTYTPSSPKAIIVFIHGFAEHIGRYTHIHPKLSERGVVVFTFDQRGFGKTALDEEHRSKGSSWGKTSWKQQLEDVDWALGHVRKQFPQLPVFLMGHSMGGGEVLGFVTLSPQYSATVSSLTGVIATSPLIKQTKPAPKLLRILGGIASHVTPYTLIPAELDVNDLSHEAEFNEAYANDPLIKNSGSLRGISDMLNKGEELLTKGCHHWPQNLPVLFLHGDEDRITSYEATRAFYDQIDASEKKLILVPHGYHELQNEAEQVREKVVNDVVEFVEAHMKNAETPSQSTAQASELPAARL